MRTSRIILVIVVVIVAVPLFGRIFWALQQSKKMDLLIVNKTVPRNSSNEVRSLNWVLNSSKILKTNNTRYNYSRDYYGYHPDAPTEEWKIRSFRLEDIEDIKENYDGLVFIDNQGVALRKKTSSSRSDYYGGINQNDYLLLKNMINNQKLIIIECSFFTKQTEELVKYNTEKLMDIFSVGWKGRYFRNLSDRKMEHELGMHWLERYKNYQNKNWDFSGPGLVFINEKQNRIIVLPADEYMKADYPEIVTEEALAADISVPERVAYKGWFDVVYPGKNMVISQFDMNLNEEGVNLLKKNGLNSVFPAAVKSLDAPLYYMAGDFSKQRVFLASSRIRPINTLIPGICKHMAAKPYFFFQAYYVPLLESVFDEYYSEKVSI